MNLLYHDETHCVRWLSNAMFLSASTDDAGHYYIGQIVEPNYTDQLAAGLNPTDNATDGFHVIVWKAEHPEEKELCGPYTSFAACVRRIARFTHSSDCTQIFSRNHSAGFPVILDRHLETTGQFQEWLNTEELYRQACGSMTPEHLLREAEGQLYECAQEGTYAHQVYPSQKRALMKYVALLSSALKTR